MVNTIVKCKTSEAYQLNLRIIGECLLWLHLQWRFKADNKIGKKKLRGIRSTKTSKIIFIEKILVIKFKKIYKPLGLIWESLGSLLDTKSIYKNQYHPHIWIIIN